MAAPYAFLSMMFPTRLASALQAVWLCQVIYHAFDDSMLRLQKKRTRMSPFLGYMLRHHDLHIRQVALKAPTARE